MYNMLLSFWVVASYILLMHISFPLWEIKAPKNLGLCFELILKAAIHKGQVTCITPSGL